MTTSEPGLVALAALVGAAAGDGAVVFHLILGVTRVFTGTDDQR